ncbi:MAG: lipid-A-disaccharide synthase [Candidatus Krumholzibacteria bacterium]|nr:lipid-A-disaccharide synthase [Candidatus Krumholzibacteria bacterium]
MPNILLTCGETSGEHHAARLVREMKALDPLCEVRALGGTELASAGAEILLPLEKYAFMGFAEVLARLPRFVSLERSLISLMDRGDIDLFIPVDYPGLNLRLARYAKAAGVPVLYFISPQVWAWGGWRVGRMKPSIDLMAVILPFERDMYRKAGIPVVFAGHPMLDEMRPIPGPKEAPARGDRFNVMLFPGSRRQVFERMFPALCGAARLIRKRFGAATFTIGLAPLIREEAARVPPDMRACIRTTRTGIEELADASLVLAASGTVTLQCALSGTPTVVSYRTSVLSYAIGKSLVKIPWIAMPNVLARRRILPELIQSDATPERIAKEALSILDDPVRYRAMSADLMSVRNLLEGPGGVKRIAEIALRMASGEDASEIERLFDARSDRQH